MPAQRKYPDELRERAVEMVLEIRQREGKGRGELARVGRQLGVYPEALRGWVKQAEIDTGTRPVQRLDLALLIHAQHHRLLRRVVIQPDDIDDLVHEERVGGQLEGVLQVRLEAELLPDPPDGRLAQPGPGGHRGPRPVRILARSGLQVRVGGPSGICVASNRACVRTSDRSRAPLPPLFCGAIPTESDHLNWPRSASTALPRAMYGYILLRNSMTGMLYPILAEFEQSGWNESKWLTAEPKFRRRGHRRRRRHDPLRDARAADRHQ